jgi:hypothetical protein
MCYSMPTKLGIRLRLFTLLANTLVDVQWRCALMSRGNFLAVRFLFSHYRQTMVSQIFEASDVTVGGVLLPGSAKEKPIGGEVVSVGPGKREKDGTRKTPQVNGHSIRGLGEA